MCGCVWGGRGEGRGWLGGRRVPRTKITMQLEMAEINLEGNFLLGRGVMVGVSLDAISLIWQSQRPTTANT